MRATLDRKTEKTLARPKLRKIAGLGKLSSSTSDLGSNTKHLRGFGVEDHPPQMSNLIVPLSRF